MYSIRVELFIAQIETDREGERSGRGGERMCGRASKKERKCAHIWIAKCVLFELSFFCLVFLLVCFFLFVLCIQFFSICDFRLYCFLFRFGKNFKIDINKNVFIFVFVCLYFFFKTLSKCGCVYECFVFH